MTLTPESQGVLTVIIPCFNEESTIEELLTRVLNQHIVGEVIIVDDCSTDRSAEIIASFVDSRIRVEKNMKNRGKGKSIANAIQMATLDIVIIQDADLEYSPEEFSRIVQPIVDGRADVVFGSRFLTFDSRRALYYRHRIGNNLLTMLSNIMTNLDLTDMETCYKAFRNKYAQQLNIQENRFGIEPEITAKVAALQLRVYEVPISYNGRTYEQGKKITWKDGFRAIWCILFYNSPYSKRKFLAAVKS